jgi:hypothetical protein
LVVVMFHKQPAAWRESTGSLINDPSDGIHAIGATIKGQPWLVITHQWIQSGHVTGGNVRRVSDNPRQVSPPGMESFEPVSLNHAHPVVKSGSGQILTGLKAGFRAEVHSQTTTLGERVSQPNGQAATARPQITPK